MNTTTIQICEWCGNYHSGKCFRVKEIEYWENGLVKRVVLHEPRVLDVRPTNNTTTGNQKDLHHA